jgi:hypothetical protein
MIQWMILQMRAAVEFLGSRHISPGLHLLGVGGGNVKHKHIRLAMDKLYSFLVCGVKCKDAVRIGIGLPAHVEHGVIRQKMLLVVAEVADTFSFPVSVESVEWFRKERRKPERMEQIEQRCVERKSHYPKALLRNEPVLKI